MNLIVDGNEGNVNANQLVFYFQKPSIVVTVCLVHVCLASEFSKLFQCLCVALPSFNPRALYQLPVRQDNWFWQDTLASLSYFHEAFTCSITTRPPRPPATAMSSALQPWWFTIPSPPVGIINVSCTLIQWNLPRVHHTEVVHDRQNLWGSPTPNWFLLIIGGRGGCVPRGKETEPRPDRAVDLRWRSYFPP